MGSNIILKKISMLKFTDKRKNRSRDSSASIKVNKMSSSICFIQGIYHDLDKTKINEFNFSLTK